MDIERALFNTMQASVIHSLMSGNDTQCFTTAQYVEHRAMWIGKMCRVSHAKEPESFTRKQLLSCRLIREVAPDVWTLRDAND